MHVAVPLVIGFVIAGFLIAFFVGVSVITGASEDQESDDQDQIEYIRRWMEEKKRWKAQKKNRRQSR